MNFTDFTHAVAVRLDRKVPEETVKSVLEAFSDSVMAALVVGDEVKIKGLGTIYPSPYDVWKGHYEFGHSGNGGKRVRLRFRPFESANTELTRDWHLFNQAPIVNPKAPKK